MGQKDNNGGGGEVLPSRELPSTGKGIGFSKDKLLDVVNALQKDLDDLLGHKTAGSLYNFQAPDDTLCTEDSPEGGDGNPKGYVSQDALGQYPAANGVYATCKTAYQTCTSVHGAFTDAYQNHIDSLRQNLNNYHGAEHQNAQNARQTGASTNNAPRAV